MKKTYSLARLVRRVALGFMSGVIVYTVIANQEAFRGNIASALEEESEANASASASSTAICSPGDGGIDDIPDCLNCADACDLCMCRNAFGNVDVCNRTCGVGGCCWVDETGVEEPHCEYF